MEEFTEGNTPEEAKHPTLKSDQKTIKSLIAFFKKKDEEENIPAEPTTPAQEQAVEAGSAINSTDNDSIEPEEDEEEIEE